MTVYVAEIKGRGIAAFHADNGAEAERLVRDRVFRDDLMVLASNDLPLWDGAAGIQVRQALPWEEAKWRAFVVLAFFLAFLWVFNFTTFF
jgi:hypothetical protein